MSTYLLPLMSRQMMIRPAGGGVSTIGIHRHRLGSASVGVTYDRIPPTVGTSSNGTLADHVAAIVEATACQGILWRAAHANAFTTAAAPAMPKAAGACHIVSILLCRGTHYRAAVVPLRIGGTDERKTNQNC
jgi:hypothetical protein